MSAATVTPQSTTQQVPPAPPRAPLGRLVFGLVLVLFGVGWLLENTGLITLRWQTVLAVAVLTVGALLLATARRPDHGGLVMLGVVLSGVLVVTSAVPQIRPFSGVGERSYEPATVSDLRAEYELGMGPLTLDLTDVEFPAGQTQQITGSVGMGQLAVALPPDVTAEVTASVGVGSADIDGRERNGVGVNTTEVLTGSEVGGRVLLDLSVGMGAIEVTR